MTEINADNVPAILKALRRAKLPSLIVLRGYPRGRPGYSHKPFTVRIYSTRSADLAETVMSEQPYSHFIGCYDGTVSVADLEADIADMIASKYGEVA
jgi:hypothetical protein